MNGSRDRKADLLRAARAEFASKGFERAVISSIAESAGLRRSTVFYHFTDKEALHDAAVVAVLRALAVFVCDASRLGAGFDAQLGGFVKALLERLHVERALPRLLLREAVEAGTSESGFGLLAARMSEIVDSGVADGSIAARDLTAPGAIVTWLCAELVAEPATPAAGTLIGLTPSDRAVDRCRQVRRLLCVRDAE